MRHFPIAFCTKRVGERCELQLLDILLTPWNINAATVIGGEIGFRLVERLEGEIGLFGYRRELDNFRSVIGLAINWRWIRAHPAILLNLLDQLYQTKATVGIALNAQELLKLYGTRASWDSEVHLLAVVGFDKWKQTIQVMEPDPLLKQEVVELRLTQILSMSRIPLPIRVPDNSIGVRIVTPLFNDGCLPSREFYVTQLRDFAIHYLRGRNRDSAGLVGIQRFARIMSELVHFEDEVTKEWFLGFTSVVESRRLFLEFLAQAKFWIPSSLYQYILNHMQRSSQCWQVLRNVLWRGVHRGLKGFVVRMIPIIEEIANLERTVAEVIDKEMNSEMS